MIAGGFTPNTGKRPVYRGQMRGGEMQKTRIRRGALVVAALAALGTASGGVIGTSAAGADTCGINSLYGHTINDTNAQVQTSDATHGVTNTWCGDRAPSGSVAAHGRNDWLAGDNVFETHVRISYRFPDGTVVNFNAESRAFTSDRITAGCSVAPAGSQPSPYGCFTRTRYLGESYGEVDFVIVRVAP
jgi:hypothetical protein